MAGARSQSTTSASTVDEMSSSKTTSTAISPGVIKSSGPKTYRKPKNETAAEQSMDKLVELLLAIPRGGLVFLMSLCMGLKSGFEVTTNAILNGVCDFKAGNVEEQVEELGKKQARRLRKAMARLAKEENKVEVDKQIAETTNSADSKKKKQRRRPKKVREGGKAGQQEDAGDAEVPEGESNTPMQPTGVIENSSDDEGWTRAETKKAKKARRKQLALVQAEDVYLDQDISDQEDPKRSESLNDSDATEEVCSEESEDVSDQEDLSRSESLNDSDVAEEVSEDVIDQCSVHSEHISVEDSNCSEDLSDLDVAEEDAWTQVKYKGLKRSVSAPSIVQAAPKLVGGRYAALAEDSGIDKEMTTEVAELSSLPPTPAEEITPPPSVSASDSEERSEACETTPKPAKTGGWKPASGVLWSEMEDEE